MIRAWGSFGSPTSSILSAMGGARTLQISLGERSYPIEIGTGRLQRVGEVAGTLCPSPVAGLITDSNVGPLYGDTVRESLAAAGFRVCCLTVPAGEGSKDLAQLARLCSGLAQANEPRKSPV